MRGNGACAAVGAATVPEFGGGGGGYTFGDQVSLSTRAHVEGALDDWRLTPIANRRSRSSKPFMARLEADATAVLVKELEGQMSSGQLDRGSRRCSIARCRGTICRSHSRRGPTACRSTSSDSSGRIPVQVVNSFALPPDQTNAAIAAIERFKARIRPADTDRAALLAELKDVVERRRA